jgi:hypothetical protein
VPWVLVILVLLGLLSVARGNHPTWIFWTYAIGVGIHTASQLSQFPDVKWWLTGVWYGDPYRAASVLPLAALPLISAGVQQAWDLTIHVLRTRRIVARPAVAAVATTAFLGIGVAVLQNSALTSTLDDLRVAYRVTPTSSLLTTHELRLIRGLPSYVKPGEMIAGNPMTGAALGYAFADRPTVEPFAGLRRGRAGAVVMDRLDLMRQDPRVCRAVHTLDVRFVLDFGGRVIDGYRSPGLENLSPTSGFTLVAADGPARLYRISGCRGS